MSDRDPAYRYRAYGLHVHSDVPLPFDPLPQPASIGTSEPPDVTVCLGSVPETLPAGPGHPTRTSLWQARPGAFLMDEGTVRFLVTGGRDVLINPLGSDADDVAAFVLQSSSLQPGIGIEPLPSGSAFWALWNHTHRKQMMDAMGRRPAHFRTATVMARCVPAVTQETRSEYLFLLEVLSDCIETYLREAGGVDQLAARRRRPRFHQRPRRRAT